MLKPFFFIILLLYSTSYSEMGISDSLKSFSFTYFNEGIFGGKARIYLKESDIKTLNNHGYFYNGTHLKFSLGNTLSLHTRLRIWNDELSSYDRFQSRFEPETHLSFTVNKLIASFHGGFINKFTLGSGLTLKDFSDPGAIVAIKGNEWSGSAGIFTRGYGILEDLYWFSLTANVIPLRLNALVINTQGMPLVGTFYSNQHYLSGFLLPNITIQVPSGSLYAEYGFKLTHQNGVDNLIENTPNTAHAGLVGYKTAIQKGPVSVDGCFELRTYRKGFIPVTGVDLSRHTTFWDQNDSRANWIDFFDSRETSNWVYTRITAECDIYKKLSVFIKDELLYFRSRQKEAIVYPSVSDDTWYNGAVMRYNPSSHYYAAGIRYAFFPQAYVELSIGNKLLNKWEDDYFSYSQWGQRFIASDKPYGEVRLEWNF